MRGVSREVSAIYDALLGYTNRGWRPLLLEPKSKQTFERGWSSDPPDLDTLLERLDGRADWNVGLVLGTVSAGLVDVDLDAPEALALADRFLPPTASLFGRARKPRSHRLYVADGTVPKSAAYRDVDGAMLVELRADKRISMVPPSVHPSGERVEWERDGEPAHIRGEELAEAVKRLAAAALIARHWPKQGARQDAALALAGGLVRLGWPADETIAFVHAVADVAGDDEVAKRAAAARDTVEQWRTSEPTTGWRRLAEIIGTDVVRRARHWLAPLVQRIGPYALSTDGIRYVIEKEHGFEEKPLANFTAAIDEVVVADDGVETRRFFVLCGRAGEQELPPLRVPAEKFATMSWVMEWAPRAVLHAGQTTRDRVREAIQLASLDAPERIVYAHSGWRQLGGHWCFLHANGALGADGPVDGVRTELPEELSRYIVADPPDSAALRTAVAAVWHGLPAIAPAVYAPLFGAVVLAPLTSILDVDAAVWVVGATGLLKTSFVSALLNLYGAFPPTTAPAGFESTPNYLEKLAFIAKDLPLLIDDVRPPQTTVEAAEWRRKVERLVRAVGNRTGRGRMAGDTTLRGAYPPRALVLVTGEDEVEGSSTIGRTLLVRFTPETVRPDLLARWQQDPRPLQQAGAGYLQWLARLLDQHGPARLAALRDQLQLPPLPAGLHPRLPRTLRLLLTGWTLFTRFAVETGAVDEDAAAQRLTEVAGDLVVHAETTGAAVRQQRPSHRFIHALGDLLASRRVHLEGRDGGPPRDAAALGWATREDGTTVPCGERIGWADEDGLYLIPTTTRAWVGRLLRESGEVFAVSNRRLLEELERDGYLLPDGHRGTSRTAVLKADGKALRVWALSRPAAERCWSIQQSEGV
jgi:hypothetical protein